MIGGSERVWKILCSKFSSWLHTSLNTFATVALGKQMFPSFTPSRKIRAKLSITLQIHTLRLKLDTDSKPGFWHIFALQIHLCNSSQSHAFLTLKQFSFTAFHDYHLVNHHLAWIRHFMVTKIMSSRILLQISQKQKV
jgi:hypothetical protein